jgi:hypothetical protein
MNQIKLARALRFVDYSVGAATLGYGVVTAQPLWIGGGVAGLALAHLNLSDRISSGLRKYFGRKTREVAPPPPALEVPVAPEKTPPTAAIAFYGAPKMHIGPQLQSQSRHSLFATQRHLNHTA